MGTDQNILSTEWIGEGQLYSEAKAHNIKCAYTICLTNLPKPTMFDECIHNVIKYIEEPFVAKYYHDKLDVFHVTDTLGNVKAFNEGKQTCWLAKSGGTVFNIRAPYMHGQYSRLKKSLKKQPFVFFDVSRRRFQTIKDEIRFSKRIRSYSTVISLREELDREGKHITNKNHIKTKESYRTKTCWPFHLSEEFRFETARSIYPGYECTDGPKENVVFSVSESIQDTLYQNSFSPATPRARGRYPEFDDETRRYQSFATWPLQADVQDVSQLAKHGFYYSGQCDLVRCYYCGLGLKDWSHSDDAMREHVKYSPNCAHIGDILGPERLQQFRDQLTQRVSLDEAGGITYRHERTARHPEFLNPNNRRRTYAKWPSSLTQTPDILTEAGFFYTGFQDQVRCYACDGGLQHWDTDDEPWIEHARWFPHCWHVKEVKGQNFVTMVQLALAENDGEVEDAVDTFEQVSVNDASGGGRESENPIYSPAAQGVINLGFSKAAVQMAIQECAEKGLRWNLEILLDVLLAKQEKGEVLPSDSPRSESPELTTLDVSTSEGVIAEHGRLRRRLTCICCDENGVDVLFLPCAHLKMCMKCATEAEICPVCAKEIKDKVKTYMV